MKILTAIAAFVVSGCVATGTNPSEMATQEWRLVYSHDAQGQPLSGSKDDLIEVVRAGVPVRVYWAGRRVEHITDAKFLTILGGEVFTQIETIQGQSPSVDPPAIELRDNTWSTILSTNGDKSLKWFSVR